MVKLAAFALLTLFLFREVPMADAQTGVGKTVQELEALAKQAEAETKALEAQASLIAARKKLDALQHPPARTEAEDAIAAAKAAQDVADARKKQYESELQEFKARLGEVPSSGIAGTVTLAANAGKIEAELLASAAIDHVAARIAAALPQPAAAARLFVYATQDAPTFQALTAYRVQTGLVGIAFATATAASDKANEGAVPPAEARVEGVAALGAAGVALDAVTKLAGYFRSDFSVQGIDMTPDDALLVAALANRLRAAEGNRYAVHVPALYNPGALATGVDAIKNDLLANATAKARAQARSATHDRAAGAFAELAKKSVVPEEKVQLGEKAELHRKAAESLRGAIALQDALLTRLATPDDKGATPLVAVVRESAVVASLAGGARLLLVKASKTGGSLYTEKNLWTSFGRMPFFVGAGVVATYVLLDGVDGKVLASGVVPRHGGFVSARDVPAAIND
jgi:hypothetical protein